MTSLTQGVGHGLVGLVHGADEFEDRPVFFACVLVEWHTVLSSLRGRALVGLPRDGMEHAAMAQCPGCSKQVVEGSATCPFCSTAIPSPVLAQFDTSWDVPRSSSIAFGKTPGASGGRHEIDPTSPTLLPMPPDSGIRSGSGSFTKRIAPPEGQFDPGTMIAGRYRIVKLLGKGGMGEVYQAEDLKLELVVALKFLPEKHVRDEAVARAFLNEVRTARRVTHANVCRVYDIEEFEGRQFISMEYVDGENVSAIIKQIGHLPEDRAIVIARQVCAGLAAAHA